MTEIKEGWSNSVTTRTKTTHYFKDGISLCKRAEITNGHRNFDLSEKDASDAFSFHCKSCIKKQQAMVSKQKIKDGGWEDTGNSDYVPKTKPSPFTLNKLCDAIRAEFSWIETCFVENDEIIVEEGYEQDEDEKNDDDCCDKARENGELIVEQFPQLEVSEYYCHRHKYAIVDLKLKTK